MLFRIPIGYALFVTYILINYYILYMWNNVNVYRYWNG